MSESDAIDHRAEFFHNKRFTFPEQKILDREGNQKSPSLLISQEGRTVIAENKNFLQGLKEALKIVESREQKVFLSTEGTLFSNPEKKQSLSFVAEGSQSQVFHYGVSDQEFIIKIMKESDSTLDDLSQPYQNEMLQIQALHENLGNQLNKLGILLPKTFFASDTVSCSEYIDGRTPTNEELPHSLIYELFQVINQFIDAQKKLDSSGIWDGIQVDIYSKLNGTRLDNFRITQEGKIYLIDPFLFTHDTAQIDNITPSKPYVFKSPLDRFRRT